MTVLLLLVCVGLGHARALEARAPSAPTDLARSPSDPNNLSANPYKEAGDVTALCYE